MAALTMYPEEERLQGGERFVFNLYMISAVALFALMMLIGLALRMEQGGWLPIESDLFYRLLGLHGAGVVGTMGMVATAVMWFFLRKYVPLHLWAFLANYVLFLVGALCIIGAILIGNYGALWTFLYPMPVDSMGMWGPNAAAAFMLGYLLIGVGMLVFYLDAAAAIIRVYGNLGRGLGLQWLFGGDIDPNHPKAVVASVMVIIANSIGILVGAVSLVMSLVNIYYPEMALNALVMKTLIYWFGHTYINATIYMAVIGVYELLPRYSGKPYPISRPFLWAWAANTLFVIAVFPHHLMMDYVEPHWMLIMGQIISHSAGFPVFLITVWGALTNIYRSGMRWTMPARLLILSMFGWSAGAIPAMIDATISVNQVMHNTQWVPGHFHFYLLLGALPMTLALMYHVIGSRMQSPPDSGTDRIGLPVYVIGGVVFTMAFLDAGRLSVPRRMDVHLPQWLPTDHAGAIGAILVIAGMLYFAIRISAGLLRAPADVGAAHATG